jgi:hypothetical protein
LLASLAGLGQLAIPRSKDFFVAPFELVFGSDITDGAMEADIVVMGDIICDEASGVVERQRHLDTDAIAFEGLVPTLDFAI